MRTAVLTAVLAAATAACRTAPRAPAAPPPVQTVSDADLGRLAPEQMGPLQQARATLDEARDAVARARLRLQDSRHEEGWANAERAQAEGDRLRAAAELSSAREAGDARQGALAGDRAEAATLRAQAADARLEYGRRLVAARDAEVRSAEARVRRVEWEVERSKLLALRKAGLPAASKYDPAPIEGRIAEAAKAEEAARVHSRDLGGTARASHDRWRALEDRYEARARSIPTG